MRTSSLYLLVFIASVFLSCETIVDEVDLSKFPDLKEKVVVTAFIGPQDEIIKVRLNKSTPLYGTISGKYEKVFDPISQDSVLYYEDKQYITDAAVSISNGAQSTALAYSAELKSYAVAAKDFKILPGQTIRLSINWNGSLITSTTLIPENTVVIQNLKIDPFMEIRRGFFENDTATGYKINFQYQDVPGKVNYYKLWGELEYKVKLPVFDKANKATYVDRNAYAYLFWPDAETTGSDRYQSDAGIDGSIIKSINGEITQRRISVCPSGSSSFQDKGCLSAKNIATAPQTIKLQIWNTSKDLYDYSLSLRKFNASSNNPFSEPTPVYNNIKNGLGIFAGYNGFEGSVKVK